MTIEYTAGDHILPAERELLAELRAGRPVADLAAECAEEYERTAVPPVGEDMELAELDADDFEKALRKLASRHGVEVV